MNTKKNSKKIEYLTPKSDTFPYVVTNCLLTLKLCTTRHNKPLTKNYRTEFSHFFLISAASVVATIVHFLLLLQLLCNYIEHTPYENYANHRNIRHSTRSITVALSVHCTLYNKYVTSSIYGFCHFRTHYSDPLSKFQSSSHSQHLLKQLLSIASSTSMP